jgi:hypothetical protein
MTDTELLTAIKASDSLKALADAGRDNDIADAINAAQPAAVPITVASLAAAAPTTLAGIGAGANYLSDLEVIASRIRAGDATGIGSWADTLLMLGKMSQTEHTAVEALVAKAATPDTIDHSQVSRVLNAIRPTGEHGQIVALPITNWT